MNQTLKNIYFDYFKDWSPRNLTSLQLEELSGKYKGKEICLYGQIVDVYTTHSSHYNSKVSCITLEYHQYVFYDVSPSCGGGNSTLISVYIYALRNPKVHNLDFSRLSKFDSLEIIGSVLYTMIDRMTLKIYVDTKRIKVISSIPIGRQYFGCEKLIDALTRSEQEKYLAGVEERKRLESKEYREAIYEGIVSLIGVVTLFLIIKSC